jgi:hypothetical protein
MGFETKQRRGFGFGKSDSVAERFALSFETGRDALNNAFDHGLEIVEVQG